MYNEHLFVERTFYVLEPQSLFAQSMMVEEESISSDTPESLLLKAKTQNALKLVKEEYFLDKMPKNS